jgi:carbamoyl-phosphate synthase large subunit
MKSVGEVMAIGRNFQESVQKALRGLEVGVCGFDEKIAVGTEGAKDKILKNLKFQVLSVFGMLLMHSVMVFLR